MSLVHVYNEWDPLEEIIVGTPRFAKFLSQDISTKAASFSAPYISMRPMKPGPVSQKIIEETEEDISAFVKQLEKLDIKVRRPAPINFDSKVRTPDWEREQYCNYNPRDVLFAFGNMILETPNAFRSTYFLTHAYKEILIEYFSSGTKWISAPKPRLQDEIYNTDNPKELALKNLEPVFDAANLLRAGKDIFYLVSDSGNEMGWRWLQTILGSRFRIHPCRNLYKSVHIDSTIALLRPGLVLANPTRVNGSNLPTPLKKWEVIFSPRMVQYRYSDAGFLSSEWLGMNMLMLRPDLAIVDKHQLPLIHLLEKNGIQVMPMLLRHGRTLGGGFHCITLDVRRKGDLEDYFE